MEFREQIWPIKDRLYRLALRLVNDRAEAEDVVQEVMIKLWRQGQELHLVQNLEAWCFRLTRNLALDKLKGGYQKRRVALPESLRDSPSAQRPDQQLEWKDTYEHIQQVIRSLPEQHRLVVHLRDIEGLSYQEIADALDMSMPQVKTNLFRARQVLRKSLQNRSAHGC
jgi:RNA polymerase sigma-70 factor (family 1)